MWACEGTFVGNLRVRSMGENGPTARLVLSGLLRSANLRPAGVSPSAVLIVRHLADPLPGRIVPHGHTVRVAAAWEQAAQAALADLYRRAARPSQGYVPASAEAVLFTDEGEMLACLALDISRGEALGYWWWRTLLQTLSLSSSASLTGLLCRWAMSVPAALYHLAERGQAITVVTTLSSTQALAVLAALGQVYGNVDLHLAERPWRGSGDPADSAAPVSQPERPTADGRASGSATMAAHSPI